MPLKLNVGLTQKVGQPNFGSRGASVHLEVELEANLVREPAELHRKVRYLFRLAQQAIDEELHGRDSGAASPGEGPANGQSRPATDSQLRAIHAIADRGRIDLASLLRSQYDCERADELSLPQASRLIDELKAQTAAASPS